MSLVLKVQGLKCLGLKCLGVICLVLTVLVLTVLAPVEPWVLLRDGWATSYLDQRCLNQCCLSRGLFDEALAALNLGCLNLGLLNQIFIACLDEESLRQSPSKSLCMTNLFSQALFGRQLIKYTLWNWSKVKRLAGKEKLAWSVASRLIIKQPLLGSRDVSG